MEEVCQLAMHYNMCLPPNIFLEPTPASRRCCCWVFLPLESEEMGCTSAVCQTCLLATDCQSKAQAQSLHPRCLQENQTAVPTAGTGHSCLTALCSRNVFVFIL